MLSARAWHEAVSPAFAAVLRDEGFSEVRPHQWVSSVRAPLRYVVEVQSLKGGRMGVRWGLSLDYTPHVVGNRAVKWHRTPKSARFDVTWDPIDWGSVDFAMSQDFFADPATAQSDVEKQATRVASTLARSAVPQLIAIRAADQLPPIFEEWLGRRAERFGFWNYVQAPLAYSFTLAFLGQAAASKRWLRATFERQTEIEPGAREELEARVDALLARSP